MKNSRRILLLAWTAILVSPVQAAPPAAGPVATAAAPAVSPSQTTQNDLGIAEETPNHRRQRLGQPIVATFAAPDYGEALETPNHRRQRLGLPTPAAADSGSSEETPNQRRQRLASANTR